MGNEKNIFLSTLTNNIFDRNKVLFVIPQMNNCNLWLHGLFQRYMIGGAVVTPN